MATVFLVAAEGFPLALDASLPSLELELRANFWLLAHVLTTTLSYAVLALASGISNLLLAYFICGAPAQAAVSKWADVIYRLTQFGTLLLAVSIVLGSIWADQAWGRFWNWDLREVRRSMALFGYLIVLGAREARWVRDYGLAALNAASFALVLMAWYGGNYILRSGVHSDGLGTSGACGSPPFAACKPRGSSAPDCGSAGNSMSNARRNASTRGCSRRGRCRQLARESV